MLKVKAGIVAAPPAGATALRTRQNRIDCPALGGERSWEVDENGEEMVGSCNGVAGDGGVTVLVEAELGKNKVVEDVVCGDVCGCVCE